MGNGGVVRHDLAAAEPDPQPKRDGLPRRVVLVPGVLALLPEYAGLVDPVAELRAACLAAVSWLAEAGPVTVIADPQGRRVAEHLLAAAGAADRAPPPRAARRTSWSPTAAPAARRRPRATSTSDRSGSTTRSRRRCAPPDPLSLAETDAALAEELLAGHAAGLRALGGLLTTGHAATVDYADDPFGVQYWVMRWAPRQAEEGPCAS